jgi:hypothetical protein
MKPEHCWGLMDESSGFIEFIVQVSLSLARYSWLSILELYSESVGDGIVKTRNH